jgi:hypothetical protein
MQQWATLILIVTCNYLWKEHIILQLRYMSNKLGCIDMTKSIMFDLFFYFFYENEFCAQN